MADKKNVYTLYDDQKTGTVTISDQVVYAIAALAALEVEGIASLQGDLTAAQAAKASMGALSKCIRILPDGEKMKVQIVLNIKYGFNLPEATKKVQEKVKDAIENMTGMEVSSVNISISDVKMEKTPKTKKVKQAMTKEG